jgi:parvulin-like peptidyl-prolyl isomerase
VIGRGILLATLALAAPASAWAQDAGARDASVADAGVGDAGAADASPLDGGLADARVADAGTPMLLVGPSAPFGDVYASTTEPQRAIASALRVPLVTAGDVAAEINRRAPELRAAYVDPARVEELARSLVRDRVLAEAARRAGLLDDPEVKRELERTLGRILLERAQRADAPPPPDEAAARAFYDAHLLDYTKPEQVRVLGIVTASRAESLSALAEVSRVSDRRFGVIAHRRSTDQVSRRRNGSFGWLFLGSRPEDGLVEAALALRVGETTTAPLELDGRFYVLRVVERRAPEPVPFERARSAVASRLAAEARQRTADVLLARFTREQGVRLQLAAPLVRVGP